MFARDLMACRTLYSVCSSRILSLKPEFRRGCFDRGRSVFRFASDVSLNSGDIFQHACPIMHTSENKAAIEVMLNHKRYTNTLYLWHWKKQLLGDNSETIGELFCRNDQLLINLLRGFCRDAGGSLFDDESEHCSADRPVEAFVSDRVISQLGAVTDCYLAELMRAVLVASRQSQVGHMPSLHALASLLDNECVERMPRWSLDTLLLFSDLWFHQLTRRSHFFSLSLYWLCARSSEWSRSQLVQTMFYINITRSMPSEYQFQIESRLCRVLDQLSIDELGIVCMAFFKTKTEISSVRLRASLVKRLNKDFLKARQEMLGSILKCLRFSLQSSEHSMIVEVYNRLEPHVHKFSSLATVAFMSMGSKTNTLHRSALLSCSRCLMSQLHCLRLKDIERMLMCLFKFNVSMSIAELDTIVAELEKVERYREFDAHPLSFIALVNYLCFFQCYSASLIQAAYRIALENIPCNKVVLGLVKVDHLLRVENSKFCQPLPKQMIESAFKSFTHPVKRRKRESMSSLETFTWDLYDCLYRIYCTDVHIAVVHVLPHFATPDIVVCLDRNGNPVPFSDHYLSLPPASIKWLHPALTRSPCQIEKTTVQSGGMQDREKIWLCIVPQYRLFTNARQPVGNHVYRMRQLDELGYRTIEIRLFSKKINMYVDTLRSKIASALSDHFLSTHFHPRRVTQSVSPRKQSS